MTPTTAEWVKKEADFRSLERELRARKTANYDLACFCAQQCAEKYLKAVLAEREMPIPKTHDLMKLINLLAPEFPELSLLLPVAEGLIPFVVEFRYPGPSATKALTRQAYRDCALVREAVRRLLRLPGNGRAR